MCSPYWFAAIPAVVALTGFLFELHFLVLLVALSSTYQNGLAIRYIERRGES